MPWNGCRQYQVTMMVTGAAAVRSRLARKAVFSQVRYGQPDCVIAPGIIPQRPRDYSCGTTGRYTEWPRRATLSVGSTTIGQDGVDSLNILFIGDVLGQRAGKL